MEAASEKKRGRPPVFSEEYRRGMSNLVPEVKTYRGMSEVMYRQRASSLLRQDSRFLWLADFKKADAGVPGAVKWSILAALGRIPNDETLKAVALRICELKPKTKEAVAIINRFRLGREPEGGYLKLFMHLEKTLNTFFCLHPSIADKEVIRALRDLASIIENDEE